MKSYMPNKFIYNVNELSNVTKSTGRIIKVTLGESHHKH